MESEIVDSKLDKDRALRELHQARESKEVITEELRQLRSKLRLAEEETTALRRHLEATGKAMEKEVSKMMTYIPKGALALSYRSPLVPFWSKEPVTY